MGTISKGKKMSAGDRAILTRAVSAAIALYDKKRPRMTVITSGPDREVLDILEGAIEQSEVYKAVAGHVLFSADSGVVLHSPVLAIHLFYKADKGADYAADWLIRLLTTRAANGVFKAAIWGLTVEGEIGLTDRTKLVSFDDLPTSFVKRKIADRARSSDVGYSWLSYSLFDKPGAAYVQAIRDVPYIRRDNSAFKLLERVHEEARELWSLLEVAAAGQTLAIGYWFEYEDRELDIAEVENYLSWTLPEVTPRIRTAPKVDAEDFQTQLHRFTALPSDVRRDLLRSANRFALSQCRRQNIDRVLDLALAFETAVSGEGPQAPPGWKISVRTAQIIGGPLQQRLGHREQVGELYKLRNAATHGSKLDNAPALTTVEVAAALYVKLFRSFLRLGTKPDWTSIEIETAFRD